MEEAAQGNQSGQQERRTAHGDSGNTVKSVCFADASLPTLQNVKGSGKGSQSVLRSRKELETFHPNNEIRQ